MPRGRELIKPKLWLRKSNGAIAADGTVNVASAGAMAGGIAAA
jgi:hypothetical protein